MDVETGLSEQPLFDAETGVKDELEEHVAELLFDVVPCRTHRRGRLLRRPVLGLVVEHHGERLDRVERLVGLLEKVPPERRVRLGSVPRAALPKLVHQRDEILDRVAGRAEPLEVHRGQVVGTLERGELANRERRDALVREPQMVKHDRADRRARELVVDVQCDVGQHLARVRLGEQERAGAAQAIGQVQRVAETEPDGDRVHRERRAREVEEAEARHDDEVHVVSLREDRDGSLPHRR